MTEAKTDRRTERTRRALMTAFVDLLLAEGYEAVTVERIVERANVGRSTFYIHYKSKEDLLKESMTRPSSFLAIIVGHNVAPDIVVHILNHFHEQRKLNRIFFTWPVRPIWVKCLATMIEPRLATVSRLAPGRPILPLPLIALQLAEAQIALVANWLTGKLACKPEAIAEALIATTQANLAAMLRCKPGTALFIPGERLKVLHNS
jgi:AcrR family transcriptional regulator